MNDEELHDVLLATLSSGTHHYCEEDVFDAIVRHILDIPVNRIIWKNDSFNPQEMTYMFEERLKSYGLKKIPDTGINTMFRSKTKIGYTMNHTDCDFAIKIRDDVKLVSFLGDYMVEVEFITKGGSTTRLCHG